MNTTETKRAVIYCRVSTKEQVDEGNSLVSQEKICREYALKQGYEIVETFIEQGESAKTTQRTELQKLLNFCAIKKNNISVVIAYKIDRISRNTDDYSQIRILLKRYGVEIKSTTEYFENTPAGRFMENIIANVAQFDNDVRTERSIGGMKEACKEGRYVWNAPPGYSNIKINGKCTIAPNSQASLVEEAFKLMASGVYSIEKTRQIMNNAGLTTGKGKPINKAGFTILLKNILYTGIFKKFGEVYSGTFKPIISKELFELVQKTLQNKRKLHRRYEKENPDFPLRRFVRNNEGRYLTGAWSKGKTKKYPYYWFVGQKQVWRKEDLETKFVDLLNRYNLDSNKYPLFRDWLYKHWLKKVHQGEKELLIIDQQLTEIANDEAALIKKNIENVISNEQLKRQLNDIEEKRLGLERKKFQIPMLQINKQELFVKVKPYLINQGKAWQKAPKDLKLKLQEFNFPLGLILENNEFRTPKICSIFKAIDLIFEENTLKGSPKNILLNTPFSGKNKVTQNELVSIDSFAEEVGNDLIALSKLPENRGKIEDSLTPQLIQLFNEKDDSDVGSQYRRAS